MSLMRLLSLGQSIVTPDRPGPRYKIRQQSYLPKFDGKPRDVSVAVKPLFQQGDPRAGLNLPVKTPQRPPWLTSHASKVKRPGRNQFAGHSLRSSAASTFVQGELMLENVKVARNDLSETDLEIVPAKSKARSAGAKSEAIGLRDHWCRWIWLHHASRLLNAVRALF